MQPHQQRVIDEKCELDERLSKLIRFIEAPCSPNTFELLSEAERSRLRIQRSVMESYSLVLGERIAHFS